MKKIIVFSNMYPTKNHPTFGIFVKNQVNQLKEAGVNLEVIAIDEPGKGKVLTLKKYFSWFMRSMKYLVQNNKNISMTHAHYAFPTGVISLIGKRIFKIPYAVTVHGGDIDKMAGKHSSIQKMTRKILQGAEAVIVVGEQLKQDVITRFGVSKENVEVLSMGVDTKVFKKYTQSEVRNLLGIHDDGEIILFVGNVIREKGVAELIQAYAKLRDRFPNSSLYILGSQRNDTFIKELGSMIQAQDLSNVHFIKPIQQEGVAKWMAAANVLALPSYHEGFGLVALEAMATGTPVVGSDVGGLSYLLQDGTGVLVRPKEVESLADGLEEVLIDENNVFKKDKMKAMVKKHSTETILQRLLTIYSRVGR
ncbi:glycosyltransferase [Sporosarcina ureilytica]|uniref:Glycosyl transferase family 1 n=1 Tax=Sporosarcina ureilytica TaxID=298596 RepID=A0A1D8JIL1_9BACL|nr:glycosyltransferase [Sporosarcina ureilytica]AOV08549.1 hypothetical protein BI350_14075 [Sporosarcina ureilytica]